MHNDIIGTPGSLILYKYVGKGIVYPWVSDDGTMMAYCKNSENWDNLFFAVLQKTNNSLV